MKSVLIGIGKFVTSIRLIIDGYIINLKITRLVLISKRLYISMVWYYNMQSSSDIILKFKLNIGKQKYVTILIYKALLFPNRF